MSSYFSEHEVEGITLAQLNKEKERDAQELKDNAHEDEDADASYIRHYEPDKEDFLMKHFLTGSSTGDEIIFTF